jgi:S1-C subfamily serine protease
MHAEGAVVLQQRHSRQRATHACMQRVRVSFNSGTPESRSFDARIIGNEPAKDLAVLKVDVGTQQLVPVHVGSASGLRVGQFVFAVGNPSGLSKTQSCGVVSGLNRAIPSPVGTRIPGAIQTDAAISAGALLVMLCNPCDAACGAA